MPRIHYKQICSILILFFLLFIYFNLNLKHAPDNFQIVPVASEEKPGENKSDEEEQEKIDWEDHEFTKKESQRKGPGEHGTGVSTNADEKERASELMNVNGFNALASDKISVHRSTKDLRRPECGTLKYSRTLPRVSIIIPFHDEHWSTLLRTVHSLLARAPRELVQEVILVDDNSTKSFLGAPLDRYMVDTFNNVRILRTGRREGLIRARLVGAKAAQGPVLVFIDSHCEAGINWLPPLLEPILQNYRTVTCPFIDVINEVDFDMSPQDEGARGAFDWNFDYKRLARLDQDKNHPEMPFDSPVMAGGLFAINKAWFWELGGYDPGLEVWGGEQYELSFKLWMCGGRMLDVPCSRIGHVYRKFNPFGVPGLGDYCTRNYKRIAEVWMDDWKKHLYNKHPDRFLGLDPGDLSEQRALRTKLKCHSFDWFMKEVAFDLVKNYPVSEPKPIAKGKIISDSNPDLCMDSRFGFDGDQVRLESCISKENDEKNNGEQHFAFSWRGDIHPQGRGVCFDFPGTGRVLVLITCHNSRGNQYWKYDVDTHQLKHVISQKCVDSKPKRKELFMADCEPTLTQKWTLEGLDKKAAKDAMAESV